MQGHGQDKFKDASLIETSARRSWTTMSAELRRHTAGEIAAFTPQNAEITMIVSGAPNAVISRASGGVHQVAKAHAHATWLCPAGIREEATRLSGEIPEVLHLYLPHFSFLRQSDEDGINFGAQDLRYQSCVDNRRIEAMLVEVVEELRNETAGGGLRMDGLAAELVVALARDHAETPSARREMIIATAGLDRRRLARVLDYVETHLEDDLTVGDLAIVANVSLFHFARAFHISTGRPPHAYVSERRLDHARRMLTYGNETLCEIALACRFSSQSNFTKAFRKATGVSPGFYRRSVAS
jgi:AraC family transcriptional regulator